MGTDDPIYALARFVRAADAVGRARRVRYAGRGTLVRVLDGPEPGQWIVQIGVNVRLVIAHGERDLRRLGGRDAIEGEAWNEVMQAIHELDRARTEYFDARRALARLGKTRPTGEPKKSTG